MNSCLGKEDFISLKKKKTDLRFKKKKFLNHIFRFILVLCMGVYVCMCMFLFIYVRMYECVCICVYL